MKFLILVLLITSAVSATAQQPGNLEGHLAELGRYLEFVRALVSSFNDPRASELLEKALVQVEQARAAIARRRFQQALTYLKLARSLAEQAARLTLEGPAARLRTRSEELIRRAEGIVIGKGIPQAERMLQRAKENHRLAIQLLERRHVGRAIEHYRVSQRLARQAMQLVEHWSSSRTPIELAREQFERLRKRAAEVVEAGHHPNARKLFLEALRRGRAAEQSFNSGHLRLAADQYNQAIRLFTRVLELSGTSTDQLDVRFSSELIRLDELIASARQRIGAAGASRAQILLERAERLRREAEQAASIGQATRARWKLKVARNLVARALSLTKSAPLGSGERVETELERLLEDISVVRDRLASIGRDEAIVLLRMAERAAERARRLIRRRRPRLALEAVLVGNRYLFAAESLLAQKTLDRTSREELQRRLDQLGRAIESAEQKLAGDLDELQRLLLDQARAAHARATEALGKDQRAVARINIALGLEALRKIVQTMGGG